MKKKLISILAAASVFASVIPPFSAFAEGDVLTAAYAGADEVEIITEDSEETPEFGDDAFEEAPEDTDMSDVFMEELPAEELPEAVTDITPEDGMILEEQAVAQEASGSCGDNLTWTLSGGTLTVSGSGAMTDWDSSSPWYNYRDSINRAVINNGVTSIGRVAFYNCSGLTSVTIPNSVTSIGIFAFGGCRGLTSVTIPTSVTSIGNWAFGICSGLTSVTIPTSVTSIGSRAFYNCSGLTSVTIPTSVTIIGNYAFDDCTALTDVYYDGTQSEWETVAIGSDNEPLTGANIHYASLAASGSCGDNVVWTLNSNGLLTIVGSGAMTDWSSSTNVPWHNYRDSINRVVIDNGVTSIGRSAFYNCSGLMSVTIPTSVTSIGRSAFEGCSGLTSVTIPNSVTSIGSYAFEGCSGLTSVTIPNSVTSIGNGAFGYCSGLTEINVDEGNIGYCSVDGVLFDADMRTIIAYPTGKGETSYSIPTGVTGIGSRAFYNCSGLTSVTIPTGVTNMGSYAFYRCSGLTGVTIPTSVTSIGYGAFQECSGLTSVTIPTGVTSIENSAFEGCSGLTSVTIPNSVTSIGSGAFRSCSRLTSITIPTGVTNIGSQAFYYSGLTSVTISTSVMSIEYGAFQGCSGLTSVTIPNSVTSIGSSAFYRCSGLTSVTIPNSVTSIGSSAFYNCTALTDVYYDGTQSEWETVAIGSYNASLTGANIHYASLAASGSCGDNVVWTLNSNGLLTIVGSGAMTDWGSWSDVPWYNYRDSISRAVIDNGVTSIGSRAFYNCRGLTSVTIPTSVTSIGSSAFWGCSGLTSVTIPTSVTSIGSWAFYKCSGLTSVTIPTSVTSIGSGAFDSCSGLTEINVDEGNTGYCSVDGILFNADMRTIIAYPAGKGETSYSIPTGVTSIGSGAFSYCSGLTSVTIPTSVTSIGSSAFAGCRGLTSVTIPTSVTSIGSWAFEYCRGLTSVTIPTSVTSIGSGAFSYCSGLTSVTIPNSVTSIDSYAFEYCSGLTDVYYMGRSGQWQSVTVNSGNGRLTNASMHYLVDDAVITSSTIAESTWNHTYNGEYHYWEFTPAASGTYVFQSTLSRGDSVGYVYDSSFNMMYSNDDGGENSNFLITFNAEAGRTYYLGSRWYGSSTTGSIPIKLSRRYTLSYSANGGSGAPAAQTKLYGETLTLSNEQPTRAGCTFLGWSSSSTASTAAYMPGAEFTSNADATLYAVWYVPKYTVSYNANGGSGAPAAQTKTYGETLTLSGTIPTRLGYTFAGWGTSSSAAASEYNPGASYSDNSGCTLYAIWQEAAALRTATQTSASANIPFGGAVRYFKFTPFESGTYVLESTGNSDTYGSVYSSSGSLLYSDDDSGTGANFRISFSAGSGTSYYLGVKYYSGSSTGSFNVRVTREYTVQYSANGGSGAPSSQTKLYGEPLTLSETVPSRTGYNFLGWALSSGASSAAYAPGSSCTENKNLTLYAVWAQYPAADAPIITVSDTAESKTVSISCPTNGAVIYYTLDGSSPTTSSAVYSSPIKITSEGSVTVKAKSVKNGYTDSIVNSRSVTLSRAQAPGASVQSGAVDPGTVLRLTSSIANAKIYYTTNGSTPTASSALYTGELTITPPMTVKAIVSADGYITSTAAEYSYTKPLANMPVISVSDILGGKSVSMYSDTAGADIYYTTNGQAPGTNSSKYTGAIELTSAGNYTIKAIAVKQGYENSAASSQTITLPAAAAPQASVPSGETAKGTSVALSCGTPGTSIRYTTDGSSPDMNSLTYSSPISLENNTTIRAFAVGNGYSASSAAEFKYTIPRAQTPNISAEDTDGGKNVSITSESGAEIYYTTDGSEPTVSSMKYSKTLEIKSAGTYTIRAVAVKNGCIDSDAAELSFTVRKLSAPQASLPSGSTFEPGASLSLTSDGGTIYYTTDGSDPKTNGKRYNGDITLNESVTIKAYVKENGCVNSETAVFSYTRMGITAAPVINVSDIAGGKSAVLSCTTAGARIYYTTDGSAPSESSTVYTAPINITAAGTVQIRAVAMADGSLPSEETSNIIVVRKLSTPNAAPQSGRVPKGTLVNLSSDGGQSTVYYTTDGSNPSESGTVYTDAIVLNQSVSIKAVAVREGYENSDVTELNYEVYEKCTAPVINITKNNGVSTVELSCSTEGAEIRYTTDGSNPTKNSSRYTAPIVFDSPISCTVKAIAVRSGSDDSDVVSKDVSVTKTQKPTASVNSGRVKKGTAIELSGSGTIYYTVNNGEEKVYSGSIIADADMIIRAYAVESGSLKSDAAEYSYTVEKITSGTDRAVTWNFLNGELVISGSEAIPDYTAGAAPWYDLADEITKITVKDGIDTIGANAFYGMNRVSSVSLASTVRQINGGAFEGCGALRNIALPEGMNAGIGNGAFKDCKTLGSVTVPNGVISIGLGAFEGCSSISEITLPFIGSAVGSSNNKDTFAYIFGGNVPSSLKKVNITGETDVPQNAFKDLTNISNISINAGVKTIGSGAFDGCSSLKAFEVPNGVKNLGDNMFRGCASAETITVPDSVASIGEAAFDGCARLKSVNIPHGVKYIYAHTFRGCSSLTSIEIPTSIISIGEGILEDCTKLIAVKTPFVGANADPGSTSVTPEGVFGYLFGTADNTQIPASVTRVEVTSTDRSNYIPKEAFKNCANIEDIIINGGRSVLDNAFENCKFLKHLYIPKSVSIIGNTILKDCTNIKTLTVPFIGMDRADKNTASSVVGGFFGYDDNDANETKQYYDGNGNYHYYKIPSTLKNVSVLNQTEIPVGAFMKCDFIENVSIVTGVALGDYAFNECISLQSVTLPSDMQTIGKQAFAVCESLETVNIPNRVKTIGSNAFYNARALKNVTMPDSVTEIADDIFIGTNLISAERASLMADEHGGITCSKDSAAYKYAVAKGIRTNVVDSSELNVRKTSTTVDLLSDNSYMFDITDSYNMRGTLMIELYDADAELVVKKSRTAEDIEYRVEFSKEEMKNVSFARIYISGSEESVVSTEDELISVDGGEIPVIPESDIEMDYHGGTLRFSGTTRIKTGTVLLQAIYNSDGSLNKVNMYPVNSIDDVIQTDTDFTPGTVKFMLWDSMDGMKPLAEPVTQ